MAPNRITRRRFVACLSTAAIAISSPRKVLAGAETSPGLPKVDLHVHLSEEMTLEKLAERARTTGCKFGVVEHPGPRYSSMSDDQSLSAYMDRLDRYGFFKGIQPVDPGWRKQFSKEALAGLDYVLMDALEIPDQRGGYEIIWRDDFQVEDVDTFMARYVEFYVRVLEQERPDILASPTFLPKCLRHRYDELWTDQRVETIVNAAIRNRVAVEINSMYKIPSKRIVQQAKQLGALFSFGTNGRTAQVIGALDYSFDIAKLCDLAPKDIFIPKLRSRSSAAESKRTS